MTNRKRILHVMHSMIGGGITTFVTEVSQLNPANETYHSALLWQKAPLEHSKFDVIDISKDKDLKKRFKVEVNNHDRIFVHSLKPFMIWTLFKRKNDVFLFQHGISFGNGISRLIKKLYYTLVINLFGFKVICSSEFAKQKLLRNIPILNKQLLLIIPFGIKMNYKYTRIKSNSDYLRIGFAGRFVAQKRISRIVDALSLLKGDIKIELHIAGNGPQLGYLQEMAAQFDQERIVFKFHGFLENMDAFYNSIDIFILPSVGESFGLVVLEALSRNIPSIVFSDSGACTAFISNGHNGFIVNSEIELSNKLVQLSNKKLLHELQENVSNLDLKQYDIANTRFKLDAL